MIEAEPLSADGIRHGFFTRRGGVSDGIYDSLNIGIGSKDLRENVMRNRALVADRLGVSADNLALPYQYHSAEAVVVERAWQPGAGPKADAVVSRMPGVAIGVSTADCGPVLFADRQARVIGAAHAGWRGALGGVLEATIEAMEALGAERRRIVAALGPTISAGAYEVGPEFRERFVDRDAGTDRFFITADGGELHFDLPGYIERRLTSAMLAHVTRLDHCTYREEEEFFSYRRATHRGEPDFGRLVSAIALEG